MGKNFHDVRNAHKMLAYGSAQRLGPFKPKPKKKELPGATNTEQPKADQQVTKTN